MTKELKITIIILVILAIIIFVWYAYNIRQISKRNQDANYRILVTCVPNCAEDEVCIKGACVKKKINYTS